MIPFLHGILGTAGAAAGAFESIATVTASGGETSLSFTSIPQNYVALQIRGIAKDSANGTGLATVDIRLNGDTGANYAQHYLRGDGGSAIAGGSASITYIYAGTHTRNLDMPFGVMIIDIHDYASTTRNKTVRSFNGADLNGNGQVNLTSGLWMSTTGVTSVTLLASTSFAAGTTFALYGWKAAA